MPHSPAPLLLVPLLFIQLLAPPPLSLLAPIAPRHSFCPAKCECQHQQQRKSSPEAKEEDGEEEDDDDDPLHPLPALFSVHCLRGGINDTEFLALLQQLPLDLRELVIRGPSGSASGVTTRPNAFQWNDNINRLSRLSRLVLVNSGIPALSQAIRLPLLRELDLSGNSLDYIQLGSFLGMPMLERLDLSHNRISVLPTGAFIYLKKLVSLSLSHNRLGPELSMASLLRGPRGLRELELDGNRLTGQQLNELFMDVGGLTRLEMNHCGLNDAEVDKLNLSRVPELRRVGLAGNNLTQVPSTTLRALASLDTVDLSDNLLRSLGPCAFCGSNISRVFLAHNLLGLSGVRAFHREAYAGTRMRELDLSHNHLPPRGFSSVWLHGAQASLETLRLSGNALPMDATLMHSLPRLRELHLADSSLSSVPYNLPKPFAQLTLLNLSGNGLDLLPPNLGNALPQLRVLDLSRNLFRSLPYTLMEVVDHLELVYLHNCPWDCQCAAQPLQVHMLRRLDRRELLRYDETLCAEPPMLRAQPLHRVQKINDCAILFGANYGITQNTELMLILAALLVAALLLSATLVLSLYCGRENKQKGTYVTGEGMDETGEAEAEEKGKGPMGTMMMMSRSTTLFSNGYGGGGGAGGGGSRGLIDLDMLAMNGDLINNNSNDNNDPLIRNNNHHQNGGATLRVKQQEQQQKEPLMAKSDSLLGMVMEQQNHHTPQRPMVQGNGRQPMPPGTGARTLITF